LITAVFQYDEIMKKYIRLMLGKQHMYSQKCFEGNFVGTDFGLHQDLTNRLPDKWRDFNAEFIPVLQSQDPSRPKVALGLACAAIYNISKSLDEGDLVICPDGTRKYHVGEIVDGYYYAEGEILPHRRKVRWLNQTILRDDMSQLLQNSTGGSGTVSDISKYSEELERLLGNLTAPGIISNDSEIENPSEFAIEKHLEDFLVANWSSTELSQEYDIYTIDGDTVGQQFQTDTGPMDILAISNDKQTLLVIELKKGRASDAVVGQLLRYMSYVKDELAEDNQTVKGMVIALGTNQRLERALSMVTNVDFYKYEINFRLIHTPLN
jgi:restriction system protein